MESSTGSLESVCRSYLEEAEWLFAPFLEDGDFVCHTTEDFAHHFDRLSPVARWDGLCRLLRVFREGEREEIDQLVDADCMPEWEFCVRSLSDWEVLISEFERLAREEGCFTSPGQLSLLRGEKWE